MSLQIACRISPRTRWDINRHKLPHETDAAFCRRALWFFIGTLDGVMHEERDSDLLDAVL